MAPMLSEKVNSSGFSIDCLSFYVFHIMMMMMTMTAMTMTTTMNDTGESIAMH